MHITHQHSYLTLLLFLLENWGTSRNSISMPVCYLLCLVLAPLVSVIRLSSLGSQSLSFLSALGEASTASLSKEEDAPSLSMFHGNLPSRLHLTRKPSGAVLLWLLHLRTYT